MFTSCLNPLRGLLKEDVYTWYSDTLWLQWSGSTAGEFMNLSINVIVEKKAKLIANTSELND